MKKSILAMLLSATSLCLASGPARRNDPGDIAAIRKIGRDMGDAMVAGDTEKLNQMYADDWAIVSSSGKVVTKENILNDHQLVSYKLGPIDVQVLGDIAVAHGTVKETRIQNGNVVSGEGVYMDYLERRGGKWVVVRSGGKLVVSEPR
jgi:hypothetical protein